MVDKIVSHGMFIDCDRNMGLCNFLENVEATPEQSHDLMSLRSIGQQGFVSIVKSKFLKESSTNIVTRKKRLCTFTITKVQKQRVKQIEKERKLQQRFLKRQIAWLAEGGHTPDNMDELFCSTSSLPKALMDKNGLPYKSAKSATTTYLEKRYKSVPVLITSLPWVPTSVVMEGMFMVQTEPFPTIENMKEYVKMLFLKYVRKLFDSQMIATKMIHFRMYY